MAGMWRNLLEDRERVAISPGGSIFSLEKKMAQVGRSELFSKESLSEPALCLLRDTGDRPAKARPPGQRESSFQQKAAETPTQTRMPAGT